MEFREYRDEINHIFATYSRRGFVDYYNCRGLWSDMTSLMTEATADLGRQGQYKELFDLAGKAFLKWAKTDKDDSDGETQDFVCYVFDAWDAVYAADDPKINHAKMLEWFLKNLDGSVIDYMEDELYRYMMEHFKEDELLNRKMNFLKEKIDFLRKSDDQFHVEFYLPRCQERVLELMGELKYPIDEVRKYAGTIKSYFVKESLAKIELDYGNLNESLAIYEELAEREEQRWGRNEYREKLMHIYKDYGNQEKYFENLKLAMRAAVGNMELWEEYKSNFSKEDWPAAREEIFGVIKKTDYRASSWYAEEDRYDLVMDIVESCEDTDLIKAYEKKLKKLYPDRCLFVLSAKADRVAHDGNKRSEYRKLAGLLRWIQRYPGGDEVAEERAEKYRQAYPRRKAMLEELMKF